MKLAARIALLAGLAVTVMLVLHAGGPAMLELLARAGWVLIWLVPLHALALLLDVCGWRTLLGPRAAMPLLFWIATVREAINRLLPVANIGGEIVGIRLLSASGVEGTVAAASVILEVLLTLFSQYLFVALGVVLGLRALHAMRPLQDTLLGMAVTLPVLGLLLALLRYGAIFQRFERLAERVVGVRSHIMALLSRSADLDAAIRALYAHRGRLALTVFWQVSGLLAGSLETWLALRWLGHPQSIEGAIALESLTQAVRNFVFLVPAGLGVQEASLVGLGALLGLTPDVAITLSLVKRMREIVFGLPALLSWEWVEGWKGLQHVRSRSIEH
jgi:putative membrane protein